MQIALLDYAHDHGLLKLRPEQHALLDRIQIEDQLGFKSVQSRSMELQKIKYEGSGRDFAEALMKGVGDDVRESRVFWQSLRQLLK